MNAHAKHTLTMTRNLLDTNVPNQAYRHLSQSEGIDRPTRDDALNFFTAVELSLLIKAEKKADGDFLGTKGV